MPRSRFWFVATVLAVSSLFVPLAHSQPPKAKATPRLEPVAETKLLMEGIANPNTKALGKLLLAKPKDAEGWAFIRGQALLLGEMGNLLMIRPPRTKAGEETWIVDAAELRTNATALAKAAAAKDYLQARKSLASVANVCNRCHQSFRVGIRVDPFAEQ